MKEILPKGYSLQPVFPFFLGEQAGRVFDEKSRNGLEQVFCRYMSGLAVQYKQLMASKKAEEKQVGLFLFRRDRENLYKALHQVLDNEGDFYPLYIIFAFFYHLQPLPTEAIEFMEAVVKKLELFSLKDQTFLAHYAYVVGNLGNNYQKIKNFLKARTNYNKGLTLLLQAGKKQEAAVGYHQLGYVAQEERDWGEAKRNYTEALKIFQEFNDRYTQASPYHQLGNVAFEERDWGEAKRNYAEALKICQEFNDRYSQASTYHQLGRLAEKESDYASSLAYYGTALEIFSEYKDDYNLEITIGNLSRLLSLADWDAAEAIAALDTTEDTKTVLRKLLKEGPTEHTEDTENKEK
ncbi:MAG: tetratricopeptide repeat protein [bacterium]|nr:tetratricopeptide repeat protein [bacterium]